MTSQRTLQLSVAAFALAVMALLLVGLYAAGIIGPGNKLAPTDRSSQTGSLRAEGNLHVDRNATVSGSVDVTGPSTLTDLSVNGFSRLTSVHGTGAAQFESTLTATQGIFTVGQGRPPLVVSTSTLVPNLHANNSELLAGQPSNFFIDVSGSPQSKAGPLGVGSLTAGPTTINGLETVSGPLTVGGVASLNGNLNVPGIASLGTVNTSGAVNVNGAFGAPGTSILGVLNTTGTATVGGDLTVRGAANLQLLDVANLTASNDVKAGRDLAVGRATTIGGSLAVSGPTALGSGLSVSGNGSFTGSVTATGGFSGAFAGTGSFTTLTVSGPSTLGGGATVAGPGIVTNTVTASGAAKLNGGVSVTGGLTADSLNTTSLTGATITLSGDITAKDGLFNGAVRTNELGDRSGGTLTLNPATALVITSPTTLSGNLTVTGTSTFNGVVAVVNAGFAVSNAGNNVFSAAPAGVTVGAPAAPIAFRVNGATTITGNTAIGGSLTVAGSATIGGDLAGGKFRGTCSTGAALTASVTCTFASPLSLAPAAVIVTPGGDYAGPPYTATRYWVGATSVTAFQLTFNAPPRPNVTFYYVVVE